MLRNYFLTAWRNLLRNKTFSFINIFGLALGLACSLLILLWVQDQRRMDGFHSSSPRLYAVYERVYSQGKLEKANYGRDHHPRCFCIWMAGGGITPGIVYGETDEFGYNIARNPVHVHDFHATILNQLGLNHTKLTFKSQGRRYRLTDVAGNVVKGIIS